MLRCELHARVDLLFEPRDARAERRQVAGECFVAELQNAELCVRAAVHAELELRRRLLQDRTELDEACARPLRAQVSERCGVISAAE